MLGKVRTLCGVEFLFLRFVSTDLYGIDFLLAPIHCDEGAREQRTFKPLWETGYVNE